MLELRETVENSSTAHIRNLTDKDLAQPYRSLLIGLGVHTMEQLFDRLVARRGTLEGILWKEINPTLDGTPEGDVCVFDKAGSNTIERLVMTHVSTATKAAQKFRVSTKGNDHVLTPIVEGGVKVVSNIWNKLTE